ncbi:MAG: bacteriocin [Bacilli bacterium]|nr:bacteriocin [Bacilli bacterium]
MRFITIDNEELKTIVGGSKYLVVGIIVGIITFFIGVYDGYMRPLSCRE